MIFDSPEFNALREKYQRFPIDEVPEIIVLDRIERYSGEKALIERLISSVNPHQQKDWISKLVKPDHSQFTGAWFEIMLYGWLEEHFQVHVEPEVFGCYPDFLIDIENEQIAIEALAKLCSSDEVHQRLMSSKLYSALKSIEKPYAVFVEVKKYGTKIDNTVIRNQVTKWLDERINERLEYNDTFGNVFNLSVAYQTKFQKLSVMSSEDMIIVDPNQMKPSMKKKAVQHPGINRSDLPYVVAIYQESSYSSPEEILSAWLGKKQVVINRNTKEIVGECFDQTGLSYFKYKTIQYHSVSGILAFNSIYSKVQKKRSLRGWYIENPYARKKLDTNIFPVEGRFVVVGEEANEYQMAWLGQNPD